MTERTPEIGVRVALGAGRGSVLRFFLGRGAILTVAGVACGLGLTALTTRFLTAWLVDASPRDRPTFAAAATMAVVGRDAPMHARRTGYATLWMSQLRNLSRLVSQFLRDRVPEAVRYDASTTFRRVERYLIAPRYSWARML